MEFNGAYLSPLFSRKSILMIEHDGSVETNIPFFFFFISFFNFFSFVVVGFYNAIVWYKNTWVTIDDRIQPEKTKQKKKRSKKKTFQTQKSLDALESMSLDSSEYFLVKKYAARRDERSALSLYALSSSALFLSAEL